MAGGDHVHQAAGQASRHLEDFGLRVARRMIRGLVEPVTAPARMGHDDHDCRRRQREASTLRPRSPPRAAQSAGPERWPQGSIAAHSIVMTPTRPTLTPTASTSRDGDTFGQSTGPARLVVDQIGGEERIPRLSRARLESAAQVARQLPRRRRIDGPEIEVVVADRLRRVPHRVVRVDDEGALAEVRLDAALKRVARVDEQDRPAVCRPGRAQVVHVSREQGQAADARSAERPTPWRSLVPTIERVTSAGSSGRAACPGRCAAVATQRTASATMPGTIPWTALPVGLRRICCSDPGASASSHSKGLRGWGQKVS